MLIKYHTVGLTSGRCRSSQELSEIGTPCHLTMPAWTHLKLLKLQYVSNKLPRLLLSFNLFLTYPDARLPLMHSTYLNHCMIFDTTKEAVNRQKQKYVAPRSPTGAWIIEVTRPIYSYIWPIFEQSFKFARGVWLLEWSSCEKLCLVGTINQYASEWQQRLFECAIF